MKPFNELVFKDDVRYTETHEWAKKSEDIRRDTVADVQREEPDIDDEEVNEDDLLVDEGIVDDFIEDEEDLEETGDNGETPDDKEE